MWNEAGSQILTWSFNGTAVVWDATSDEHLQTLSHKGAVYGAAWNGDESKILTWSEDRMAGVWDAVSGKVRMNLTGDGKPVVRPRFIPNNGYLPFSCVDIRQGFFSLGIIFLANVYVTMKEYHNALANYNEAISTQPVYAEAFYLRGRVHSILKNHEQAVADFSTAIELQHQNDDELFIEMIEYEGGTHVLTPGGNPPEQLTAEMFYAFKFRE